MYNKFEEYCVVVTTEDSGTFHEPESPVVLSIWAESLENAMDCGEILSGAYLKCEE